MVGLGVVGRIALSCVGRGARRGRLVGAVLITAVVLLATGASLARAEAGGLSIAMSGSPSTTVAFGSTLSYTITVSNLNNGNNEHSSTLLSDHVSGLDNLTVTSAIGSCTQSAGLVTCLIPSVPVGGSGTLTITGTVIASSGSVLHNTATVGSNPGEEQYTNSASLDTTVTGGPAAGPAPPTVLPDLTSSIIAPSTVSPSAPLTYSLVISNIGAGGASNITAVDNLPAGVGAAAVTDTTNLFGCSISANVVTCTGGRVDAGSSATITITGTAPASGTLVNLAVVNPLHLIPETNELNNTTTSQTKVVPGYTGTLASGSNVISAMNTTNGLAGGQLITGAFIPAGTIVTSVDSPSQIHISSSATGTASGEALSFGAPLTVTNIVSPSPDVAQGGSLTDTVTVTNNLLGSMTAGDIVVTVPTQGLDPASITATISVPGADNQDIFARCAVIGSVVQCFTVDNDDSELELPPTNSLTVTVTGTVIAAPSTKLYVTPTVTGNLLNAGFGIQAPTSVTQVKPNIDLSVTKASLPATVEAAHTFQLEYVIGNSGLAPASGVLMRDPLPAGFLPPKPPLGGEYTFSFINGAGSGSGKCSVDKSNVLTCSGTVGAQSTLTVIANIVAPETTGTYASTVTVDPFNAIPESDKANNTATATTTVTTGADLTVSQSVDNNPVAPSGTLTYTILVPNQGTQDVTGVEVDDTLPAGTVFRSASGDHNFTCSNQSGTVRCVGGIINGTYTAFPATDTATIKVSVFAPAAPGNITNEVRVDPNNAIPETNKANNISYLTTAVALGGGGQYIELHFNSLTSTPEPVAPNGTLTYVMVVANTGTEQAFNVKVNDTLPAGASFRTATGTGGFECSDAGAIVNCVGGSIASGSTQSITITAFAPAQLGSYTDQAIVDPNNEIPEADETNNTATVPTTVALGGGGTYIDLALSAKEAPTPGETVVPDGVLTYTLTVTNEGSAPAFNVETDDALPANATFVSATGTNGDTCELASDGRTVKCLGATDNPKSSDTITIKATAPNSSSGEPGGPVAVGPDSAIVNPTNAIPEGNPNNNTATTEPIPVKSLIDLAIEQNGPGTASQNDTPTYTLTVKNEGTATAYGVQVHDPLPVGLIVQNVTSSPNTFACQVSENPVNVIDCTGELPAKETVTVTVGTFVTAADSTTLTNEACVNPDHTIVEFNYTNNCSTVATAVNLPNLSVTQSDSISPVSPGQNEVYTIGVQNIGQSDAPGAKMTDTLPTGLTFVSASGTNGATCTHNKQEVTCELGTVAAGGSSTITLTATVTPAASGPIINTSNVSSTAALESGSSDKTASTTVNLNGTGIDLAAVSMKTDQDPVNPGAVLTYTSIIKNQGSQEATGVLIRQFLPPSSQVQFVGASGSGGFNCVLNGENVDCTGNLAAGASTTIKVQVHVSAPAPAALTSTVTADPENAIAETDKTNNSKSVTTTVTGSTCSHCFDDVMGTILSSPNPVKTEDQLTYNFAVGNSGDMPAPSPITSSETGVVIRDFIDTADLTFEKASATGGFTATYDSTIGDVVVVQSQCTYKPFPIAKVECPKNKPSTLAAGAGVIVSVITKVKASGGPFPISVGNFAEVEHLEGEFNPFNNEASNSTMVTAVGPLLRGVATAVLTPRTGGGASSTKAAGSRAAKASCRLPSLRHMTRSQARRALSKAKCGDVAVHFLGRGSRVVHQAIRAGTKIHQRTLLLLRLGRA